MIHRGIRALQERRGAIGIGRKRGDADGGGQRDARRKRVRAHRLDEAARPRYRADLVAAHDRAELVAAVARRELARARCVFAQEGCHLRERAVAGRVPQAIVDRLEAVGVDEPQRERLTRSPRRLHLAPEPLAKRARIAEPGKAVERGALAIGFARQRERIGRPGVRGRFDHRVGVEQRAGRCGVEHRRGRRPVAQRDGNGVAIAAQHAGRAGDEPHAAAAFERVRRESAATVERDGGSGPMHCARPSGVTAEQIAARRREDEERIDPGVERSRRGIERLEHLLRGTGRGRTDQARGGDDPYVPGLHRGAAPLRGETSRALPRVGNSGESENREERIPQLVHTGRVPIISPGRPPQPLPAVVHLNDRAAALRASGDLDGAAALFREAIALQRDLPELHVNLGATLAQAGRFEDARAAFECVLALEPENQHAHLALYELLQVAGDRDGAVAHQRAVLAHRRLFSERAPNEARRLLALVAPGDWQANIPLEYLVDRRTTTLTRLFLTGENDGEAGAAELRGHDVVLNAIAESDENAPLLAQAERLLPRFGLPILNPPRAVLRTARTALPSVLAGIANVVAPRVERVADAALADAVAGMLPCVVRPVGSHAGRGLERIDDARALQAYRERIGAEEYFVMPFVDTKREDGFYRKYRIIVVAGVPYPFHLAISPRWMIHYYNAPMREHAWMRAEEERFLTHFEDVFGPPLQTALRAIAAAVGLEYFGIDCAIDREGRILVFEADPAMIVHAGDDPALFGYKRPAAERIFRAFEGLVDDARSG